MAIATKRVLLGAMMCYLYRISSGQTSDDAKFLKTYLFNNTSYDKSIRPRFNQSQETYVYVEFFLQSIDALNEVSETFKSRGTIVMSWEDEFLAWYMDEFGGIEHILWPQDTIWKPDVALSNSYTSYKELGHSSLHILGHSDGHMQWSTFQVFETLCAIDNLYFPFDTQKCSMEFVAWSYTKDEVYMESGEVGIHLDGIIENTLWEITDVVWYSNEEEYAATILFIITIRRKPMYSLLTLVFPAIMLAVLNLFVFALPSDSGEKASYAITVFLTFAVFMTIMQTTFSPNSDSLSYFAVYVSCQTFQSTLITIIALIMVRVTSFDEKTKIPVCLVALAKLTKCKAFRMKQRANKIETVKDASESETAKEERLAAQPGEILNHDKEYSWREIVNALDIVFFVSFVVAFVIETLVCLLLARKSI